ncbi:hypothetical protein FOA43_001648 [Brettanomyces nanus]|uniref:CP-type G domain-containing protein n=1 Tax=Eeniella nana TaxID=13502 RepID=A0A875RXV0_EENNA|nr:uncharacterized protein FOA43_001648 [Brettanomyces nanus]QPG74321.1 hypothetical protein FOA43_001648 [Brettanomyces nanus]
MGTKMRIRKPKSKRTTTRMREGIKKKASSKKRKDRKLQKKDVTWKSRRAKDIGIPSSFPYKDRILLDIEERKREKVEELERIREEKRRQTALMGDPETQIDEDGADEEVKQDSMAALIESAQKAASVFEGETNNDDEMDMDNEEADNELEVTDYEIEGGNFATVTGDQSRKQFDKVFKSVVDASDVILYILDSRDPESTRSRTVEKNILANPDKRLILILNKVDLIPETVLKQWLTYLQKSFPTVPVKASPTANNGKTFNKKLTQATTAGQLLQALKLYAHKSNLKRAITVGVIGYPNVGKSSVINALTARHGKSGKACPVGNEAGVTKNLREVKVDNKLKILDSPGIVFPEQKYASGAMKRKFEAELALLNAVPIKAIKNPELSVKLLIKKLAKNVEMAESFKQYYQLPALPSGDLDEFVKQILIHVARKYGRLGRRGIPILNSAAVVILNDWRDGRIHGWTLPREEEESQDIGEVEQTTVVEKWSKEFDLESLFAGVFNQ